MKHKKAIFILIIIAVVLGSIVVAAKAMDFNLPTHREFQKLHDGGK